MSIPLQALAQTTSTRQPVIFDALGEIRTVYTPELIDQILASGTRAISITLTDPKVDEADAFDHLLRDLAEYNLYLRGLASRFQLARNVSDIESARQSNKLAVLYNVQNSTPVGHDIDRLGLLKGLGLTSIQLTYNTTNASGSGCFENPDPGLTAFGRQLIEAMGSHRLLLDLSHAGMKTMAQAVAASSQPVIVSHTACKALREHRRNTSDENMRAVADGGGVVGITQIRTFLTYAKQNNLGTYFDHIEHAVKVAGVDHVGIGSDRDHRVIPDTAEELAILLKEEGSQISAEDWPLYLQGMNGPRRMETVRDGLKQRKFNSSEIDKIMGANVLRLYQQVVG
ncbi:MAG: membrane dipeptidase [Pseudoxanthomonas sp.]